MPTQCWTYTVATFQIFKEPTYTAHYTPLPGKLNHTQYHYIHTDTKNIDTAETPALLFDISRTLPIVPRSKSFDMHTHTHAHEHQHTSWQLWNINRDEDLHVQTKSYLPPLHYIICVYINKPSIYASIYIYIYSIYIYIYIYSIYIYTHIYTLWPVINSLVCPLEVLPVQGQGRRVYQLSLKCQPTHYGIWGARCFYFEQKCHEQCESKVLCLYPIIIWYLAVAKWPVFTKKSSPLTYLWQMH